MYATKFLHSLIRIGIGHNKFLMNFIIGLVVDQLGDENKNIAAIALATLQEACDSKVYTKKIIKLPFYLDTLLFALGFRLIRF